MVTKLHNNKQNNKSKSTFAQLDTVRDTTLSMKCLHETNSLVERMKSVQVHRISRKSKIFNAKKKTNKHTSKVQKQAKVKLCVSSGYAHILHLYVSCNIDEHDSFSIHNMHVIII